MVAHKEDHQNPLVHLLSTLLRSTTSTGLVDNIRMVGIASNSPIVLARKPFRLVVHILGFLMLRPDLVWTRGGSWLAGFGSLGCFLGRCLGWSCRTRQVQRSHMYPMVVPRHLSRFQARCSPLGSYIRVSTAVMQRHQMEWTCCQWDQGHQVPLLFQLRSQELIDVIFLP